MSINVQLQLNLNLKDKQQVTSRTQIKNDSDYYNPEIISNQTVLKKEKRVDYTNLKSLQPKKNTNVQDDYINI